MDSMDLTQEEYSEHRERNAKSFSPWRLLPLVALAGGAALFFTFGLHEYLTFDALRDNRVVLQDWVTANGAFAAAAFVVVYALGVVFLPPSGTIMTLTGGFVFGSLFGTLYVVVGATVGATLLFLATKMSLGEALHRKAGPAIQKMEKGFAENALSYLLVLRLVPIFPFWLVNIAPAFLGVPLRTYVVGTFFGIIPGTAVYAIFGAGLGSIFDSNQELTLSGILTPEVVAGMIGLAVLAVIPVAYKKFRKSSDA